jgi:hypothetical protein
MRAPPSRPGLAHPAAGLGMGEVPVPLFQGAHGVLGLVKSVGSQDVEVIQATKQDACPVTDKGDDIALQAALGEDAPRIDVIVTQKSLNPEHFH